MSPPSQEPLGTASSNYAFNTTYEVHSAFHPIRDVTPTRVSSPDETEIQSSQESKRRNDVDAPTSNGSGVVVIGPPAS